MKRFAAVAFLCSALFGQTFEVASLKPNDSGPGHSDVDVDGNLLRMKNVTLKACIVWAFRTTDAQVSGPSWLESERFDIVAKAESGSPQPAMLQAVLADRFKLAVHRETREQTLCELVVAKNGPKLKKVDPGEDDTTSRRGHLTATRVSMPALARFLAGPNIRLGRPVVDKTGLDGVFDFTLDWTLDSDAEKSPDHPPSIFVALQEQLGLKLEARKGPVEVLIVDHVEKVPTEN
ncbi:MAG TPA: TIGR03435 family protein [Bryobacteraceae bacterium]|nr:TIGR03435 family protein [Bryobacteraceae bacterium]